MRDYLYKTECDKSPADFARDLREVIGQHGFVISNEPVMDMRRTFAEHGSAVDSDFDLHMIQICKPDKSSKSLAANPERSVLMPKFIMAFSRDGKTQIRFHHYCPETIAEIVDDPVFPDSLARTYEKIKAMIEEAIAR